MTKDQTRLVLYWIYMVAVVIGLVLISEYSRWLFMLIGIVAFAGYEKAIRPPRPDGILSPLKIIENSWAWKIYFVVFVLASVVVAVISSTNAGVGNWMINNFWVLVASVTALLAGPLIQSEVAFFKALRDNN